MAKYRKKLGVRKKRALLRESDNKCANPGCAQRCQLEFHHIKQWAIYQSHDEAHMIVVCPTCHTAAHGGKLLIDDATLYAWKGINPTPGSKRHDVLFVPAGPAPKL